MTRTLAELYVKQGLIGRAREILQQLADGGDRSALERLRELPSAPGRIAVLEQLLETVQKARRR